MQFWDLIGCQRYIYNKCVEHCRNAFKNKEDFPTLTDLRKLFVQEKSDKLPKWLLDITDYRMRDEAIRDFCKNRQSNIEKNKKQKENKRTFEMHYRSRKNESLRASLSVLRERWNATNSPTKCRKSFYDNIYNASLMKISKRDKNLNIKFLEHDSRLLYSYGEFFLCTSYETSIKENVNREKVCFIDPGLKTFLTCYDYENHIEICNAEKSNNRIHRNLKKIEKYHSKSITSKGYRERYFYKKLKERTVLRTKRLITDLHHKAASWLSKNYNLIVLPKLNFHKLKDLNTVSKSQLMAFSHCMFFDILKFACEKNGSFLISSTEMYTSKTCSSCGSYDENLGNKNLYDCSECKNKISRDLNGAINIANVASMKILDFVGSQGSGKSPICNF